MFLSKAFPLMRPNPTTLRVMLESKKKKVVAIYLIHSFIYRIIEIKLVL